MIIFPDATAHCSGAWFEQMARSAKHDVKCIILFTLAHECGCCHIRPSDVAPKSG